MERAFRPRWLGKLQLRNGFIKTATYEGMYDDGLPNQKLLEHHLGMAKGNVALTTIAYGAVSADGRTFDEQMYIHDKSVSKLKEIVDQVHLAGGKISIQLTHCGYFSRNSEVNRPLAPSRVFNEYGCLSGIYFSKAMTLADMERVVKDFALAAVKLQQAGFDAVELHMGHGYLLSQFLSPWTNKRKDEFGGSIANRARFPLRVLNEVRAALGEDFPILVKLNLEDGFKGGFNLEDCIYVVGQLEKNGCTAVVLSGGFTSKTPFYLMRGEVPLMGMIRNGKNLAERMTMALFGPWIIKSYPFKPNFFLDQAKEIRKTTSMPLVYLGGVDSAEGIDEILVAGFDFIALGRPLIHDPEFLVKLQSGELSKSACTRCNACIVEMDREGIKCVLHD